MKTYKHYFIIGGVLLLFACFTVLLYFISPNEIVKYVGVENSYLIVFLLAAVGGLSTLTGTTFFTAIATFSSGGAIPWLLGITGGLGIFISDSIFFFLAAYGRKSIPEHWENRITRFANWVKKLPEWLVILIIFLYLGFSPFPNDLLMIALVVAGFRYRDIAPVLFAGSITVATLTAYLGRFGFNLF